MALKRHFSVWTIEERMLAILSDPDLEETRWDYADEVKQLLYWLHVDRFDHRTANERLRERVERIKWLLWNGNAFEALQWLFWLREDLEFHAPTETFHPVRFKKLQKAVADFHTYIDNNAPFIPNYGERYRYGECISTAFVESTVNEVISRRMVRKQQVRWTQRGAHLLLQVRAKTLDGDLRSTFYDWYPGMSVDGALNDGGLPAHHVSCLPLLCTAL